MTPRTISLSQIVNDHLSDPMTFTNDHSNNEQETKDRPETGLRFCVKNIHVCKKYEIEIFKLTFAISDMNKQLDTKKNLPQRHWPVHAG